MPFPTPDPQSEHSRPWLGRYLQRTMLAILFLAGLVRAEQPVAEIWQEYVQNPDTHPNLPNGSYAGYQYGEREIPTIAGPVHNVRDYGAAGDGSTDDGPAIRAALDAVGPEGGVVFFPRGHYLVNGLIFVHTDRTVLRGEDRDGVELVFTDPLARAWGRRPLETGRPLTEAQREIVRRLRELYGDVIADSETRRASCWSWSGGLVWFTPRARTTYREDPSAPVRRFSEGWLTGPALGTVAETAMRGDRTVTLDAEAQARPGDFVMLRQQDPGDFSLARHLCGDGPWATEYAWDQNNSAGYPDGFRRQFRWIVEIAEVNGREITFRQPLRTDVRTEWNPQVLPLGDTIRESGIETMTLRFNRRHTWESAGHNLYPGWNGPWFNVAIHCWMRDVTLVNADNGPGVSAAKCITLADFRLEADRDEMLPHHHGTTCRSDSHDILFRDFEFRTRPLHGLNTEQTSTGIVWSRGIMAHGTFDTHRNLPFDNIRTEIVLNNDGHHGGTGGPAMGARFVHWNIEVTNGRDYIVGWANAMPDGAIVGLRGASVVWDSRPRQTPTGDSSRTRVEAAGHIPNPPNLHEAQLRLRLGE